MAGGLSNGEVLCVPQPRYVRERALFMRSHLFADDTLIFGGADSLQLRHLKGVEI